MKAFKEVNLAKSIGAIIIFSIFSFGFTNASQNQNAEIKMSNTILRFIPTAPDFIPSKYNQDKAKEYLETILKSTKVKFTQTEKVEFVDQGSSFESVACNVCGKSISNDAWQREMDNAYRKHFADLTFITPCCHKQTTLNDLNYNAPAGFAKFIIEIPDPSGDIEPNEITELEKLLGTKVRKIWAHY